MSAIPGKCRHCGCTEANACTLTNGDHCAWCDESRTVCSNPSCIQLERARQRTLSPTTRGMYPGWGYGAIVEDLRRKRRRGRRGKGRAA